MSDHEKLTPEERNKRIDETIEQQPLDKGVLQGYLKNPRLDAGEPITLEQIEQQAQRYERYLQACMFIQGGGTLTDQKSISEFGKLQREFGPITEEDEPITLEEAVKVLNERAHCFDEVIDGKWKIINDQPTLTEEDTYFYTSKRLTPFEACATAEKYIREQK